MIIKVLGTGCTKCKTTVDLVKEVVQEHNIDAEIIKVEDIMEIMQYNVMATPAVIVNDEIKIKGRVPKKKELEDLLK